MYISHYEKYPIYEAAEGGYYYEGLELVESFKVPHGKAKKRMHSLYNRLMAEHDGQTFIYGDGSTVEVSYNRRGYIGEGEMWVIESKRKVGHHAKGRHIYC